MNKALPSRSWTHPTGAMRNQQEEGNGEILSAD
jgi:hypothetical protein